MRSVVFLVLAALVAELSPANARGEVAVTGVTTQITAAGQTQSQGGLRPLVVKERVDIERRDGQHVTGTVTKKATDRMSVGLATGSVEWILYRDVLSIRDLDTGVAVAIPKEPAPPTASATAVKALAILGAVLVTIYLLRIAGARN
jgi:hypothetical protein